MKTATVVRQMTAPKTHKCIYEETIQDHSLLITQLTEKSKYKEQSIMEIKDELKIINNKIDDLREDITKIIRASEKTDNKLEKRVATMETKIQTYEEFFKQMKDDNDKRTKNMLSTIAIIATLTSIAVGVIIKFI